MAEFVCYGGREDSSTGGVIAGESDVEDDIMSLSSSHASKLPSFINHLWGMVEEPSTQDIISWAHDGKSFVVHDKERLQTVVLPTRFKHSNFASFVRQLNLYNFIKIGEANRYQWYHQYFRKGQRSMLCHIKRRINGKIDHSGISTPSIATSSHPAASGIFGSGGGSVPSYDPDAISSINNNANQAMMSAYAAVSAATKMEEEIERLKLQNEYLERRVKALEAELELGKQVQLQMNQRHDDLTRQVQRIFTYLLASQQESSSASSSSNSRASTGFGAGNQRRISMEQRGPSPFQLPGPSGSDVSSPSMAISSNHFSAMFDDFHHGSGGAANNHHRNANSGFDFNSQDLFSNLLHPSPPENRTMAYTPTPSHHHQTQQQHSNLRLEFPLPAASSAPPDSPPLDENEDNFRQLAVDSPFDARMEVSPPSPRALSPFGRDGLMQFTPPSGESSAYNAWWNNASQ
eukprot:TRINITY_DN47358_c0_g1_i1.p1 TRINITY_DN47358_c0_g1~~TRINITY_DN47358_c0_g1_i1.p1  ORF type:complete len:461 (+),score=102.47 TRINITY_DN47358_c0_g1_i1:43-1425(+)